jgi:hypothetical protein
MLGWLPGSAGRTRSRWGCWPPRRRAMLSMTRWRRPGARRGGRTGSWRRMSWCISRWRWRCSPAMTMRRSRPGWEAGWARGGAGTQSGAADVGRDHPGTGTAGLGTAAGHLRPGSGAARRPARPPRTSAPRSSPRPHPTTPGSGAAGGGPLPQRPPSPYPASSRPRLISFHRRMIPGGCTHVSGITPAPPPQLAAGYASREERRTREARRLSRPATQMPGRLRLNARF